MKRENIRDRIVANRRERIEREGHELGHPVPAARRVPVVPFGRDPFLICEIKRKSPSRGEIAGTLDPGEQAGLYRRAGVRSISVLTEGDHFSGSLGDLMAVKAAVPDVAVLRKDFLVDEEDLRVSYRAGADAVLLIASLFDTEGFARMYRLSRDLGMRPLVEVHDEKDVDTVRPVAPELVGINSRDLRTFRVDRLGPPRLRAAIDWQAELVFESGIWHQEDVLFARGTGFSGVLVGESVTRNPGIIPELIDGFASPPPPDGFWNAVAWRLNGGGASATGRNGTTAPIPRPDRARPLVKICGIRREADGRLAAELGADLLGFVFAESPRRADPTVVRALSDVRLPKVAVVVTESSAPRLPEEVQSLLDEELIDAVQFHGDEAPEQCMALHFPYYKALRVRDSSTVAWIESYRSPRVLVDAFSREARGGTGRSISSELVDQVAANHPLWLAGGLGPDNVREVVERHAPELVDVSSGVEGRPGAKDHDKLRRYFREISYADHR